MTEIRTSARAIIQRESQLLVVRYSDARGDWYTVPGGGQKRRESLEAALIREVTEETGALVRVGALRFVRECIAGPDSRGLPKDFHQIELYFECTLAEPLTDWRGSQPDRGQVAVVWRALPELRASCFFPLALLDALERGQAFGYLGVV